MLRSSVGRAQFFCSGLGAFDKKTSVVVAAEVFSRYIWGVINRGRRRSGGDR